MVTIYKTFKNKKTAKTLSYSFAFFTVIASFGIGNLTQGNSISGALKFSYKIPTSLCGAVICILSLIVIAGGIKSIAKISQFVVPFMAVLYIFMGVFAIILNINNLPAGLKMIFTMAFSTKAVGGGLCGCITASVTNALRFGVSRGCFSNEAGLGSAAISAAAASTNNPLKQGYINMTATFWDTLVVCTITGLCIACSGALGLKNSETGELLNGISLTMTAFQLSLGTIARQLLCLEIVLFAFSTILGWEYQGEKAFEFLVGTNRFNMLYRYVFSLTVYIGATTSLSVVWCFSDIANAFMAIPNLICLLYLSSEIVADIKKNS